MSDVSWIRKVAGSGLTPRGWLSLICAGYLVSSAIVGSMNLDVDELGFMREPYEMIGGDYTRRYLAEHELGRAASTIVRSYYFYWKYRPLFAPVIDEKDRPLFRPEEARFGYAKPMSLRGWDPDRVAKYSRRLVVPEPERFYRLGAGKPLLPAVVSLPQLALVELATPDRRNLLAVQHGYNYHPLFVLARLVQILSGLVTILLVYWILAKELDETRALLGASIVAFFPVSIMYFPNLHHDSILVPFALLAAYSFYKRQYVRAGVFFGLALASKNVAIILVPAFLGYLIWDAYAAGRAGATNGVRSPLMRGIKGLAIVMVVGALTLLPFAHPVSFTRELLTPIISRRYDPRGENVHSFTLAGRLHPAEATAPKDVHRSVPRPEVRLITLLGFEDTGFLFVALAALLLFSRPTGPLARMCLLILLLSMPYGIVFGRELSYRALMFVPFFAILAADVAHKRPLQWFVALLLLIDLVYCLDPMTTGTMHYPANGGTFLSALSGRARVW
jgi:hypothetical protein